MQAIAPVTTAQLLTAGQQPLMKFEIYANGNWLDVSALEVERIVDGELEDWAGAQDLTYWTEFDSGGIGVGVFRETTTVHSGVYSARLHTTAGGDYAGFEQEFTLTPENSCTLSLWYLRAAAAGSVFRVYITDFPINVYLNSLGTWQAGATYIILPASAVWLLYQLSFTAHPSYSNYRIRFYKSHTFGVAI